MTSSVPPVEPEMPAPAPGKPTPSPTPKKSSLAAPPRKSRAVAEPVETPAEEDSEDLPWSEAFDFGRLVPVEDRQIGIMTGPSVVARDVYSFLGGARGFAKWFNYQFVRCSLMETTDYAEVLDNRAQNPKIDGVADEQRDLCVGADGKPVGGRPRRDFILTLAAAKKLAMAAVGSRGAAVREYFLEQERRLLAGEGPLPGSGGVQTHRSVSSGGPIFERRQRVAASMYYTLANYLTWGGVPRRILELAVYAFEETLVRSLSHLEDPPEVLRDPLTNVWVFRRDALDAWWEINASDVLRRCTFDHPAFGPALRYPV